MPQFDATVMVANAHRNNPASCSYGLFYLPQIKGAGEEFEEYGMLKGTPDDDLDAAIFAHVNVLWHVATKRSRARTLLLSTADERVARFVMMGHERWLSALKRAKLDDFFNTIWCLYMRRQTKAGMLAHIKLEKEVAAMIA